MKKILCLLVLIMTIPVSAENSITLRKISVYDGDTIIVSYDAFPSNLKRMSIRIIGIDAPEKGYLADCEDEKNKAEQARVLLEQLVKNLEFITVNNPRWDKYGGRILGDIVIEGVSVREALLKSSLAVPYNGTGKRYDWCHNPFIDEIKTVPPVLLDHLDYDRVHIGYQVGELRPDV